MNEVMFAKCLSPYLTLNKAAIPVAYYCDKTPQAEKDYLFFGRYLKNLYAFCIRQQRLSAITNDPEV